MAIRHLREQKRQSLLSILVGTIGTTLMIASYIFFTSFNYSGTRWLTSHFGNLQWQLTPSLQKTYFSDQALQQVKNELKDFKLRLLPHSSALVTVSQPQQAIAENILATGFNFTEASSFEPSQRLWDTSLANHEIIVSSPVAKQLNLTKGDSIQVRYEQTTENYKVKAIAQEAGITGFRGQQQAGGTVILNEQAMRKLLALPQDAYQGIWVNTPNNQNNGAFIAPSEQFLATNLKTESTNRVLDMKTKYGVPFLFASSIAFTAGILLFMQILFMLADSRQEMYGVLRTLGFIKKKIGKIFFIEAFCLICGSTIVGLCFGSFTGYSLIKVVNMNYANLMTRYEGFTIPIVPYLPIGGIVGVALLIMMFMVLIVQFVARKVRHTAILKLLHGSNKFVKRSSLSLLSVIPAALVLGVFLLSLLTGKVGDYFKPTLQEDIPLKALGMILLWFISSFAAIYLSFLSLPFVHKLFSFLLKGLQFSKTSILLGLKYTQLNFKRTFTVSLLFSMLFMALTVTFIVSDYMMAQNKAIKGNKSLLGFSGYVPYENKAEKKHILDTIAHDAYLKDHLKNPLALESYKLGVASELFKQKGQDENTFSLLPSSPTFSTNGSSHLSSRLAEYKNDEQAWEALNKQPEAIILDEKFAVHPEQWAEIWAPDGLPNRPLHVGDQIPLKIYEKRPEVMDPNHKLKIVAEVKLKIIGFVQANADYKFYNLVFVNPNFYEKYKPHGFKWPNESFGYLGFNLNSHNLSLINNVKTTLQSQHISDLMVPEEQLTVDQMKNKQMITIFLFFMGFALLIGIIGLVIIQARAIQERKPQILMLRYVGLRQRILQQIFLIEGSVIGWLGIINGLIFGILGSYVITTFLKSYIKPTDNVVVFKIPFLFLGGTSIVLMGIIFGLNLIAAQRVSTLPQRQIDLNG